MVLLPQTDSLSSGIPSVHHHHTSSVFPILKKKERKKRAGCQWLMPIILATQEVEIRRIMV
jgi:hypothetical protein